MTIEQLPSTGFKPHSVSYSETSSYLLCKRKWEYGYGRSLKRVTESLSLQLGSAGHKVLEAFYRSILSEGDGRAVQSTEAAWEWALAAAEVAYAKEVAGGYVDADNKAPLREIIFDFYLNKETGIEPFVTKGWTILAVEYEAVLDTYLEDGSIVRTPVVIDLIVRDPDGKIVVVDHKFLQDFYDYRAASLQPQIPLYIAVLRGKKFKVDYGYYNMLRARKISGTKLNKAEMQEALTEAGVEFDPKALVSVLEELCTSNGIKTKTGATPDQRWAMLELKPNGQRVARQFMEQINTAQEIIELSDLPEEERDIKMHRVANKMVCQSCSFYDLCTLELTGGNVPLLLKTEFVIRERKSFDEETEEGDIE